ncbi:hypothetical protein [Streptomyces sp. C]|uniref:hypothetical protein n=1 Tax=Streptomyces sp. C TaxID=253839 RepID=UPI0001B58717|nr:hypothetical protein [Streptomyces sp. C]EFL12858.1 predicted protein [Streptomyces sp. C]
MTRHPRFALVVPFAAAACVLAPAMAAPQAAAFGRFGSEALAAVPTAACALVKGEAGPDQKPTYDLKLSGFDRGARVTISGSGTSQDVRVASNGKYVDENVKYGTYTVKVRNSNSPPLTCSKVAEEPAVPAKTVDVTSATAKYEAPKQGDVGCVIVSPGIVPAFIGTITTAGPGTVKYRWVRSDGFVSGVMTLTFAQAGTQNVPRMSWDGVLLSHSPDKFTGWAQITIVGDDTKSNRAEVSLTCVEPKN